MTERAAIAAIGDALRARRRRLSHQRRIALSIGLLSAALAATVAAPPRPRLIWNASASAPIGLYAVTAKGRAATGQMVIARMPDAMRQLAAERHYLPANVPLVKRVAAEPGDVVCAQGATIFINGEMAATRLPFDRAGRPLPWWHGCRTLRHGALFLLMAGSDASFDGRYFGPTRSDLIVGKAHPLWVR